MSEGVEQRLARTRSDASDDRLQLGEELFDWVEVRRVGRQEHDARAACLDRLSDADDLVAAEVVSQNDVADLQSWGEELLDPGTECDTVDGAVQDQRRHDPVTAQPGKEGRCAPMPVRHAGRHSLAARTTAIEPGHVGLEPRFVEKHQTPRVQLRFQLVPQPAGFGDVGAPAFGGLEGLFFSVKPSRRSVFHIVPMLADTSNSDSSHPRNSASVTS
jgi:hypothetical protein